MVRGTLEHTSSFRSSGEYFLLFSWRIRQYSPLFVFVRGVNLCHKKYCTLEKGKIWSKSRAPNMIDFAGVIIAVYYLFCLTCVMHTIVLLTVYVETAGRTYSIRCLARFANEIPTLEFFCLFFSRIRQMKLCLYFSVFRTRRTEQLPVPVESRGEHGTVFLVYRPNEAAKNLPLCRVKWTPRRHGLSYSMF